MCRSNCYVATTGGFDSGFDPHLNSQQPSILPASNIPCSVPPGIISSVVTKASDVTVVPYHRSSPGEPSCPAPPPASFPPSGRATSLSGLLCHSLPTHPSVLIVLPLHHSPTIPYRISQSSGAHHGCVAHQAREKTPPSGGTHGKSLGLINIPHMPVHRALAFLPAYLPGPAVVTAPAATSGRNPGVAPGL